MQAVSIFLPFFNLRNLLYLIALSGSGKQLAR